MQIARTLPQQHVARGQLATITSIALSCAQQLNLKIKNCIAKSNLGCSQFLYALPFPCLLFSISLAQFFSGCQANKSQATIKPHATHALIYSHTHTHTYRTACIKMLRPQNTLTYTHVSVCRDRERGRQRVGVFRSFECVKYFHKQHKTQPNGSY